MRTRDGVSPITAHVVSASLLGFLIVYAIVFSAGALYILRLIAEGPTVASTAPAPGPRAPGSPLAAAPEEPAA